MQVHLHAPLNEAAARQLQLMSITGLKGELREAPWSYLVWRAKLSLTSKTETSIQLSIRIDLDTIIRESLNNSAVFFM